MKKTLLFLLSDGHGKDFGGRDHGAVSGKFDEFVINCKQMQATYDALLKVPGRKFKVAYPERHEQKSSEEMASIANHYRKLGYFVVCIQNHMNSAAGTHGDGAEVFRASWSAKGKKLAQLILKEWKAIGQNSRGIKVDNSLNWIRLCKDVAVLTEFGFVNNPVDRKIFDTDAEIKKSGQALAKACVKFAKLYKYN